MFIGAFSYFLYRCFMYWCYCLVFLSCTESCLCLRLCILYFCFYLDCFFIITSFTGFRFNNNKTAYQPQVSETEFLNNKTRHFSHVTKSRIFKNLNLRKKADRSFHFPEKPFQAPKIIFKSPKLTGEESLTYGHLLKDKRLKFTFLREPTFQVLVRGISPPKKI